MEEDSRDEIEVLDKTWHKLTAKVHQEGFREGADEGRTRSFQSGFDQGYEEGFAAAFTQASFNGALRTLTPLQPSVLSSAPQILEELPHPDKAMCQMCLSPNQKPESLGEYKAWQSSVTRNEELRNKYRAVNEALGSEVIQVDASKG